MTYGEPARTTRRGGIRPLRIAALLVAVAAIAVAIGDLVPASSSSTAASPTVVLGGGERGAPGGHGGTPEAQGAVPAGTTVFDDGVPGVSNLDPALLGALRAAAADAAEDGIVFHVDSGWRSPEYQERLLREAVLKYGSEEEAARWVATPERSAHVSGRAVDMGRDAAAWLSAHGAGYGLCQVYRNEPWHYERRPDAGRLGCPPAYADPTHDPRMRR